MALSLTCCCICPSCQLTPPPGADRVPWPNKTGYKWRVKTGDWKNCDPDCGDTVWDDLVTAGGGPAGAGIALDIADAAWCSWKSNALTGCDCGLVPAQTTPVDSRLQIDDAPKIVNGKCCYPAELDFQGDLFRTSCFNPCATQSNPNVLTLAVSSICCNHPSEVEVWAIPSCEEPIPI